MNTFSTFHEAMKANDRAQVKTILETDNAGELTNERYAEICEESKLWMKEIEFLHNWPQ